MPFTKPCIIALASVVALALLAGCSSDKPATTSTSPSSGTTESFPVTVPNAYGTTTIPNKPERVATWGWGSTEAAIAVGVYPVAVAEQPWTVGAGNLLPWVADAYASAGKPNPALLTDSDNGTTIPYEQIIASKPDLILAPYSGITAEQYTTLSKIAPTVAFPKTAWTTSWQDTISITAKTLGRSAEGQSTLTTITEFYAKQAAANPEFKRKTFAGIWDGDGFVYVYTAADARIQALTSLGLTVDPSVAALDDSHGAFYYKLSYEKLDQLKADLIVSYSVSEADFNAKAALKAIPAVAAGKVAFVTDKVKVSAVSPPTALSVTWPGGVPELVSTIKAVLAK